ncbi:MULTISPECIES: GNAT family N-acetyltransferase [Salinicoccus]|uniref:GNAT family N-acetyltransferase n=1 Tax=Salinicoccus TaxID=45669 RepID=UPI0004E11BE6|nr:MULTISPECIES: GNAT family N-acetyltransferase [Salinicoccus]
MKTTTIKELNTEEEFHSAFPIMQQLRTHLDEEQYINLVKEAKEVDNYLMYALFDNEEIVAVCGFKPMITLYYGRFVWVCDLVTDSAIRSKGHGKQLLDFIHEWAEKNNYESVALSSGLARKEAHKFYEKKMDYDKVSYVFKKNL